MLGNERIGSGAVLAQCLRSARLVLSHHAAVADDISRQDRRKAAR